MDHVIVRKLEHLTGSQARPSISFAVETRDRPGPAHKHGAFEGDNVWIQLNGGLIVAKAIVKLCWIGEFGQITEIRRRTSGTAIHDVEDFWRGRARYGYAAVASLDRESWVKPFWAGPRSYGYEWIVLDSDKKHSDWTTAREAPRGGDTLMSSFKSWLDSR